MKLTQSQIDAVIAAAKKLSVDAVSTTVESFYGTTLGLNGIELAALFPNPDPLGSAATAVSHLTHAREEILRDNCDIPSFVIYAGPSNVNIVGLCEYYRSVKPKSSGYPPDYISRLAQYASIRDELRAIDKGHKLEALSAALLSLVCSYGESTRGSGDQGIDAIGTNHLIRIDSVFLDGELDDSKIMPGQKVIVLASSKAGLSQRGAETKLINPAHIRELVGGWLIQRSEASMWRNLGIQMLTPLQLVLVTTYRLSAESKSECNKLGVQVWGVPELIFLICCYAPPSVFSAAGTFSVAEFRNWWEAKNATRVYSAA